MLIEVPEKSEIMLRVIAKFTSSYYDNPIVFQANYKMNDVVENANRSRLVCGWNRQIIIGQIISLEQLILN
jgi:hypothetical protein